jgi:flagellar biosynthesis GTPase FlhF
MKDIKKNRDSTGWIKLWRHLLDSPLIADSRLLQVWVYCLLKANHEPKTIIFNGQNITIERGQFIAGRTSASEKLRLRGVMWDRKLKALKMNNKVNIKTNNRFSIITVVDYEKYQQNEQVNEQQNEQQMNNKRTTNEQQMNTNKNNKNERMKEEEKEKKLNKEKKIPDNLNTPEFLAAWANWVKHRQEIRHTLTPTTIETQLKRLSRWGVTRAIEAINQSIEQGYQGLFEPRTEKQEPEYVEKLPKI